MSSVRSSYRKIYRRLWTSQAFMELSDRDKLIALYLLSGPQTNRIGLFRISIGAMSDDLNIKSHMARSKISRVCEIFDWHFDSDASVIWIPSWWSFNPPGERETNFRGMLTDLNDVPETPLIALFCNNLQDLPKVLHKYLLTWAETVHSTSTAPAVTEQSDGTASAQVEHHCTPYQTIPDVVPDVLPRARESAQNRSATGAAGPTKHLARPSNLSQSDPPMDEWARELSQQLYPAQGRVAWNLVERPLYAALTEDPGTTPEAAWQQLKDQLEAHKRSHQWTVKKYIPRLDRWLEKGLYRQQLPDTVPEVRDREYDWIQRAQALKSAQARVES